MSVRKLYRLMALAIIFAAEGVMGQSTISWINSNGGDFSDPNNWAGQIVPGTSDTALFSLGSANPYTVSFGSNVDTGGVKLRKTA